MIMYPTYRHLGAILTLICLITCVDFNYGQKALTQDSEMEDGADEVINIPLLRKGNLFFIEASVDDQTGKFIFDLGAPGLVLNSTYFRKYDTDDATVSGTMARTEEATRVCNIERFDMHGLKKFHTKAYVTDLGNVENQRNIKILGLAGVSLFRGYVLEVNFRQSQLILHPSLDTSEIGSPLILSSKIETYGDKLTLTSKHGRHKLKLLLDTGAEMNVLDKDLPNDVYEGMKIQNTRRLVDGNGGSAQAVVASVGGFTIGERPFRRMKTLILDLRSMSKAYGLPIDGMLGYPFFSSGRVYLDLRMKELYMYQFEYRP